MPEGKRIHGILKASNKTVRMSQLQRGGSHFKSNGISFERFTALQCLVGEGPFRDIADPMEFHLVRWRTHEGHHTIQERGRDEVLQDYRLRVGQVTYDSARSPPEPLPEERLDETQAGKGTTATLVTANFSAEEIALTPPSEIA